MRFRYMDGKGKEITLDSVEALAARIELGAVSATTELFDASTDRWGPAESHEIFQQLVAEAAARDQGVPLDSSSAVSAAIPVPPPEVEPTLAVEEPETGFGSLSLAPGFADAVASARAAHGEAPESEADTALDEAPPVSSEGHDLLITGELEVEEADPALFNLTAAMREPPMEGFRASAGDAWQTNATAETPPQDEALSDPSPGMTLEIDEDWGKKDKGEAHPFDDSDPFSVSPAANGGWPEEAMIEDQQFSPSSPGRLAEVLSAPVLQWAFLGAAFVVMGLFGSAVGHGLLLRGLLTVGGVSFVGIATGFLLWSDPERRTLIPAATFGLIALISVPLFLIGSRGQAAASTAVESMENARAARAIAGATSLARANPGEFAMESRALEEVIDGMDSLAIAYGLDRRPSDWLHGIYLANASRYPNVEAYWKRYAEYVDVVRSQDIDWFRRSYEQRLLEAGIRPEAVDGLVARGAERFAATRARRETLYDTMTDLAEGSLALHALLLEREADIDYEPFVQKGVSEAPVVEAVPNDPELEDQMWDMIARVALSLESISALGETSPARLQAALVDSIRASIR